METGLLGLGKKQNKITKLHHDLQINIFKEDCKNFDIFLGAYCLSSIGCKIAWYCLSYDTFAFSTELFSEIEIILSDSFGILVWLFGLILSIRSLIAYSLMKSKTIRKNAKKLIWYGAFQSLFYLLCFGQIIKDIYSGIPNENIDWNENLFKISMILLGIFCMIFAILYFYSQKLGLAEEIKKFDQNAKNAAYVKPSHILDI